MTLYLIRSSIVLCITVLCFLPSPSAAQLWLNEKEGIIYPWSFNDGSSVIYRYNGRSLVYKQFRSLLWNSPISKPYLLKARKRGRIGGGLLLTGFSLFVASQNVNHTANSGKQKQNLLLATSLFTVGIGYIQLLNRKNHVFKGMNAFNTAANGGVPLIPRKQSDTANNKAKLKVATEAKGLETHNMAADGGIPVKPMEQPDTASSNARLMFAAEARGLGHYFDGKKISVKQADSILAKSTAAKKPYLKMQRSKRWMNIGVGITTVFFAATVVTGLQRNVEDPNYVQSNAKDNRFAASMVGVAASSIIIAVAAYSVKEHRNSAFKLFNKESPSPFIHRGNNSTKGFSSITLGATNNGIGLAIHF